jgi:3-deoxy-manno-octulosonate cytidylyltransferase (CMP-KDO synthetase)
MKFVCIIPARYASQRLPGKPLLKLGGQPMIEWVYRRACRVSLFEKVVVATDDQRILDHMKKIGGNVIMTPEDMASGTDRVAYVAQEIDADVIVNLQGDEPLISSEVLEKVCVPFEDPQVNMVTPITRIKSTEDMTDVTLARVIIDKNKDAIYFTRATIPYNRDLENRDEWHQHHHYFKHIGIYAYRRNFLLEVSNLPPGKLEKIEKLEQLRVIENGYQITPVYTDYKSVCVDTPQDLQDINNYISEHNLTVDYSDGAM